MRGEVHSLPRRPLGPHVALSARGDLGLRHNGALPAAVLLVEHRRGGGGEELARVHVLQGDGLVSIPDGVAGGVAQYLRKGKASK